MHRRENEGGKYADCKNLEVILSLAAIPLRQPARWLAFGISRPLQEDVMAKGQMRAAKEKKKPKADKDKPKQLSAYKLAQMQGSSSSPYSNPPGKKS